MHVLVSYEKRREHFHVECNDTVESLKAKVLDVFHIDIRDGDRKCVVLNYLGADLNKDWVISDIGIHSGVTLSCCFREEFTTKLFVYCVFNGDTIEILEDVDFFKHRVSDLRSMITRLTSLPVTTFRLTKADGTDMYDNTVLERYDLQLHDTLRLETWDGWNEFLKAAIAGQTSQVLQHISNSDERVYRFKTRVALFIAAHHGHMALASSVLRLGVRSDQSVGEHPARDWCTSSHIDSHKTPVHEAAENGQVNILRMFVNNNSFCVVSKDGNGLSPLNAAMRKQKREAAIYLLSKRWTNLQFSALSMPLVIYLRVRKWCDKAKERVLMMYGPSKSSMRHKKVTTTKSPCQGSIGVYVDGFTNSMMNSKPKHRPIHQREEYRHTYCSVSHPRLSGMVTPANVKKYRRQKIGAENRNYPAARDLPSARLSRFAPLPHIPTGTAKTNCVPRDVDEHESDNIECVLGESGKISVPGGSNTEMNTSLQPDRSSIIYERNHECSPIPSGRNRLSALKQSYKDHAGLPKTRSAQSILDGEKDRFRRNRLARMECWVSLPVLSIDAPPRRPFFHAANISNDIPRRTVHAFDKMNGQTTYERAIDSLTVASAFKDKPWLSQVKLAMDFTQNNIRKSH